MLRPDLVFRELSKSPRRRPRCAPATAGVFALLVTLGPGGIARGQDESVRRAFLPTQAEYTVLWQQIDDASRSADWDGVVEGLARFAELVERPEVNVVLASGASLSVGLREQLSKYVSLLPRDARTRYAARLDATLERAWKEAEIRGGRWRREVRWRIVRDYPDAALWRSSSEEEIDEALLAGAWTLAGSLVERWIAAAESRWPAGEAGAKDIARAHRILLEAYRATGDVAGAERQAARCLELRRKDATGELDSFLPPEAAPAEGPSGEPAKVEPPRDARSEARAYSPGELIWEHPARGTAVRDFLEERAVDSRGGSLPLAYRPAAEDGTIVFQHSRTLAAYDTTARKELWSIEVGPDADALDGCRAPLLGKRACFYSAGPYLVAADRRDGSVSWRRGFEYDPARREVHAVRDGPGQAGGTPYSISPPAFVDGLPPGRLVVAVAVRQELEIPTFLVCLGVDGTELWSAFLGVARSGRHLGLGDAGSAPAASGIGVYHVTNTGLLAAVDAVDGTLRWVHEYPRMTPQGVRESLRSENRWDTNPVLFAGGSVIVAPGDAAILLAVDPRTGDLAWSAPRQGGSSLIGSDDKACFVSGAEVVAVAHSGPAAGTVLWRAECPGTTARDRLGRGTIAGEEILVPTRERLFRLSAEDGSVLSATYWGYGQEGGNLVLAGRFLGVAGPASCAVFDDREDAESAIARRDRGRPETILALAEFRLKHGERSEALALLEDWSRSGAPVPPPNSPLERLQLDIAELIRQVAGSGTGDEPTIPRLLRHRLLLEVLPSRKVIAAIDLARELERRGDAAAAVGAYREALRYDDAETEYFPRPLVPVRSRTWVRDRLRSLRASSREPARDFGAYEEVARAALAAARAKGTPQAFEEVFRLHPSTAAAGDALVDFANAQVSRGNPGSAASALEAHLEDVPDEGSRVRASLLLHRLLLETGRGRDAGELRRRILEAHGAAPARGAAGALPDETVAAYLERVGGARAAGAPPPRPLRFPVRMAWRSPAELQSVGRDFLEVRGAGPGGPGDAFHTQSLEMIECRDANTGFPSWTVRLDLIPGFQFRDTGLGFRFPRSGDNLLVGRYAGGLLIVHDDLNVFAVDPARGMVRWHVPAGAGSQGKPGADPVALRLRERILGAAVGDDAVFVVSTARATGRSAVLRKIDLAGKTVWERDLSYEPTVHPLSFSSGAVFVHSQRPFATFVHDAAGGGVLARLDWDQPITSTGPIEVPGGRLLLPTTRELRLLDLATRRVVWSYSEGGSRIDHVDFTAEIPDQCLVVLERTVRPPGIRSLALASGRELWRYEGFETRRSSFVIRREGRDAFLLHADAKELPFDARWELLALRVGGDGQAGKLWPTPVELGLLAGGAANCRLHVTDDSVILSDPPASVVVIDRTLGTRKTALTIPVSQFLVDKGDFASAVVGSKLVLLTSAGDAAFEEDPPGETDAGGPLRASRTEAVRAYLDRPSDPRATLELATRYFRDGRLDRAIALLDAALYSEDGISSGAEASYRLGYLLEGFQEERMKEHVPRIASRRMSSPPAIDGGLEDAWDIGSRERLRQPMNVRRIPAGDLRRVWEGEEDLSAVLYTGWDEKHFYVALDVTDDVLHPYDRDAENWKGDCLVIGLDPTGDGGYRQRGNDQLMTLALTVPRRDEQKKEGEKPEGGEEGEEDAEREEEPDGLFSVKKKDDDSGAIYELALPWTSFSSAFADGEAPAPGFTFGLSLLLTDDDTGQGATKTLSLNPCHLLPRSQKNTWAGRFLVPNFFPRVVLE